MSKRKRLECFGDANSSDSFDDECARVTCSKTVEKEGLSEDKNIYCMVCDLPIIWHEKNAKFPLSKLRNGVQMWGFNLCHECLRKIGLLYLAIHDVPVIGEVFEEKERGEKKNGLA